MTEPIETTTLYGAQVELGGKDAPYSEATVRRMIRDGVLDAYGGGRLLRISLESIREYQQGKRIWHRSAGAASAAQAPSSGSGTGRTSPARPTKRDPVVFLKDRQATNKQKKRSKSGTAR